MVVRWVTVALLCAMCIVTSPSNAAESIGEAVVIKTEVTGAGGAVAVADPVHRDERISTSDTGLGQFTFRDGTRLAVGLGSTVVLDKFVFDDSDTVKKLTIKAAKGTFRWISGNSASSAYQIVTPAGTIGVRGTAFDFYVGDNGKTAVVLLNGAVQFCGVGGCKQLTKICDAIVATRHSVSDQSRADRSILKNLGDRNALPFLSGDQQLSGRMGLVGGNGCGLATAVSTQPLGGPRTIAPRARSPIRSAPGASDPSDPQTTAPDQAPPSRPPEMNHHHHERHYHGWDRHGHPDHGRHDHHRRDGWSDHRRAAPSPRGDHHPDRTPRDRHAPAGRNHPARAAAGERHDRSIKGDHSRVGGRDGRGAHGMHSQAGATATQGSHDRGQNGGPAAAGRPGPDGNTGTMGRQAGAADGRQGAWGHGRRAGASDDGARHDNREAADGRGWNGRSEHARHDGSGDGRHGGYHRN